MLQLLFLRKTIQQGHDASYETFRRLKVFTTLYAIVWTLLVVFLFVYWFDLNTYLRWTLAVVEALLVPDITSLRIVVESYASYSNRVRAAKG